MQLLKVVGRCLLVVLAVASVAAAPAPAAAQYVPVIAEPTAPGSNSFTISGSGATPDTTVEFFVEIDGELVLCGSTVSDASGGYTGTCTLPPGTLPGDYRVVVVNEGREIGETVVSLMDGPGPTVTTQPGVGVDDVPAGDLPRTGSDTETLVKVGSLLVAAGFAAVILTRRSRRSVS